MQFKKKRYIFKRTIQIERRKINEKNKILEIINEIDAELNTQRIYLRIMQKNKWIDTKKFEVAIGLIYEMGKIIGGLLKYYAKNIKE